MIGSKDVTNIINDRARDVLIYTWHNMKRGLKAPLTRDQLSE